MGPFVGQSAGYLISMQIDEHSGEGLRHLLMIQLAVCATGGLLPFLWFPSPDGDDASGRPDGASGGRESPVEALLPAHLDAMADKSQPPEKGMWEGVRAVFASLTCTLLLSTGIMNGWYTAWQAVLPIVYKNTEGFSDHDGDLFAFTSGLAYCLGGYLGGELGDRCFQGRLKYLLIIAFASGMANFAVLIWALPSPFSEDRPGWSSHALVMALVTSTGIFAGATTSPALELLAEVSYPVSEGTTANLSMLLNQLAAVASVAIGPAVRPASVDTIMGAIFVFCGLALLPIDESSRRREAQAALQNGQSALCRDVSNT